MQSLIIRREAFDLEYSLTSVSIEKDDDLVLKEQLYVPNFEAIIDYIQGNLIENIKIYTNNKEFSLDLKDKIENSLTKTEYSNKNITIEVIE